VVIFTTTLRLTPPVVTYPMHVAEHRGAPVSLDKHILFGMEAAA
jgi:hypothetical protein